MGGRQKVQLLAKEADMSNNRLVVRVIAYGAAAAIAVTAAALTLQAGNADIDRHNAAHRGNAVRSEMPGWSCSGQGCAVRAVQMNVVE